MKQHYYVVNAGRFGGTSRATHIIQSSSPSTPNPGSIEGVTAQLLWFGGNAKRTLCGLPATRHVDAFTPGEVSCRECRRRWEGTQAQRARQAQEDTRQLEADVSTVLQAMEDGTPRGQLSRAERKVYDDLSAWEQAKEALADGTPRSQLSRAARKEYDDLAPHWEATQAYHRSVPREQVSPAALESYDKLTAQGGPHLFANDQTGQADTEQARAAVNDALDNLERLFAATDLARVSDTDLQEVSASLEVLAAQIDSSDAASGESGREWRHASADRIARLRAQLDAAAAQAGQSARQWAEANMPDAITDTTRYGAAGIAPGDTGSDAARQWVQDNVPEAGKIRDVTLVGFDDIGAPMYHITYETQDDDSTGLTR